MTKALSKAQQAELEKLEAELKLKEELPFLFGWSWYAWAWDFFNSTNKICLLTAANQISKSSTQIRKIIHWATATELWPKLWNTKPKAFVYFYPSMDVATVEVKTKWIPEFLPRGSMQYDEQYGWKAEYNANKKIVAIHFNSGVSIYFKSYEQTAANLQTITAYYIAVDEECPVELYDEIAFRIAGTNGYFSSVFTATKGQEFWRCVMEEQGTAKEKLVGAFKRQISTYDCLQYRDGKPSPWTIERIKDLENRCKNEQEVLKRIHGRFVRDEGLRYQFSRERHLKTPPFGLAGTPEALTSVYAGVDYGSGNKNRSKSAIVFASLSADSRKVRVFKAWRGDETITTAGDLFNKYMELKTFKITNGSYDYAARDFYEIASRNGEPFSRADKARERGDELINTLLRYDMIEFDTGDEEVDKLCMELASLAVDDEKHDDLADAFRYCVMSMPIDWTLIQKIPLPGKPQPKKENGRYDYSPIAGGDKKSDEMDPADIEMMEWQREFGD